MKQSMLPAPMEEICPERPAWDYSSTKTNRTQAIEYTRVKAKAGPSSFNRHEVHQNFYYETRPAIHEMSAPQSDLAPSTHPWQRCVRRTHPARLKLLPNGGTHHPARANRQLQAYDAARWASGPRTQFSWSRISCSKRCPLTTRRRHCRPLTTSQQSRRSSSSRCWRPTAQSPLWSSAATTERQRAPRSHMCVSRWVSHPAFRNNVRVERVRVRLAAACGICTAPVTISEGHQSRRRLHPHSRKPRLRCGAVSTAG